MRGGRQRWTFIAGILILLLGTRAIQTLAARSHAPPGSAQVAIAALEGDVEAAVRWAVDLSGGLAGIVHPGDTVVVKPNLVLCAPADSGMVTDPAVVRAVVQVARQAGAGQVIIAEGTAGDAQCGRSCTQTAFRTAGYDGDGDSVDDATGAPLVDLNDSGGTDARDPEKVRRVVVPTGLIRQEYWLPNLVLEADVLISVPVLKNHYLAGVTLGMKNLIGLLPNDLYHAPRLAYGKNSLSHSPIELDQHIVDVNLARAPDFVVVDGQRGMIDGPVGSQVIDPPMGLILAGSDVVAVDTVGALAMGYDPRTVPYLALAAESGLGRADTGHIRVVGVPLSQVRRDFPAPYADASVGRADAQPPTIAVDAPAGPWLEAVTVSVEASDNDALARVDLYLDDRPLGQALTPPYRFVVDPGQHAPGAHRLRAVAYDRCLNRAEVDREVQFAAPAATDTATPPPTATATPTATSTAAPPPTPTPAPPTSTPTTVPMPVSPSPTVESTPSRAATPTPTAVDTPVSVSLQEAKTPGGGAAATPPVPGRGGRRLFLDWPAWVLYSAAVLLALAAVGVLLGLIATVRRG